MLVPLALAPLVLIPAALAAPQKDKLSQSDASRELQRLYDEDHHDQDVWDDNDPSFPQRQTERCKRVREILTLGKLGGVQDWANAAWLMQHGDTADDYCLAHVLSVPPAIDGLSLGGFAVAATLDRFLESIQKKQVFSTQSYTPMPGPPEAQPFGAYESMPNSMRRVLGLDPVPGEGLRSAKGSAKDLPKLLKLAEKPDESAAEPAGVPEWLARTREIVGAGGLQSDKDYLTAAQVLLHSSDADDLLMSHACAVAASVLKNKDGLRLSAETLDAFLLACNRAQVFGTALGADGKPRQPCKLVPEVVLRGYGIAAAKKGK